MFELNLLVVTTFLQSLVWFSASSFFLYHYYKSRIRAYSLISGTSLSYSLFVLLQSLAYYYNSEDLLRIGTIFSSLMIYTQLLFITYTWHESLLTWIQMVITVTTSVALTLLWFPESIGINYFGLDPYPTWTGVCALFLTFNLLFGMALALYWFVTMWKKALPNLKKRINGLILGSILFGPCALTSLFIGENIVLSNIFSTSGLIIIGLAFIREPKLLYLLPFSVHRLVVIESSSGLTLFHYEWSYSALDEVLLGALLHGLQNASKEILQRGHIRELDLDAGTILFMSEKNILVGLLASKFSNYLRGCLYRFTRDFQTQFHQEIAHVSTKHGVNIDKFAETTKLIEKHFAFIPI